MVLVLRLFLFYDFVVKLEKACPRHIDAALAFKGGPSK